LTPGEEAFLHKHRQVCVECDDAASQSSVALNFLRAAAIEVEVHPQFDERVIRKLKVQRTRESLRYWSPAVAGAFIAGLAIVAALQMITRSSDLPHLRMPGAESEMVRARSRLSLDQKLLLPPPPR
ncbi:MAG TPA: hypothetical protein VMI31_02980, partial [Fimbriimonadaceae bacterium]|nr:hypothetical protein [Fimbriimonadaceae bacterium]